MLKSLNAAALGPKRMVQMLLGAAGLVLVVAAVIVFLMESQIHDMEATVSGKESQVGSSEQIARRYQETQTAYDEIASRTQFLESAVSAKQFVPTLLQQLQALAQTTHLTVTAVRPGLIAPPVTAAPAAPAGGDAPAADAKKAPPPPYDTLDIGVDVTGTYADTAAFLYNLTRFPKIISVASVQIHPGPGPAPAAGGKPAAPTLNTNLHLTAFVFHSDDKAAIASPPLTTTSVAAIVPAPPVAPAVGTMPGTTAPAMPAAPSAPSAHPASDAAAHAASHAIGIGQAAKDRSEVGIETL